jgi:hypothetical protein
MTWTLVVPANTTATTYLPGDGSQKILLNEVPIRETVQKVGAGKHHFIME